MTDPANNDETSEDLEWLDEFDEEFTDVKLWPVERWVRFELQKLSAQRMERIRAPRPQRPPRPPRKVPINYRDRSKLIQVANGDALAELPPVLATTRRRRGLTQIEVAERMRRAASTVCALERGEFSSISIARLEDYVSALGAQLRVIAVFDDEKIDLFTGNRRREPG